MKHRPSEFHLLHHNILFNQSSVYWEISLYISPNCESESLDMTGCCWAGGHNQATEGTGIGMPLLAGPSSKFQIWTTCSETRIAWRPWAATSRLKVSREYFKILRCSHTYHCPLMASLCVYDLYTKTMTWYQLSHMDSLWEPYKFWGHNNIIFQKVNITFRKKKYIEPFPFSN